MQTTSIEGRVAQMEAIAIAGRMIDDLLSELQEFNNYKIANGQVTLWVKKQISRKGTPFINITPNSVPMQLTDRFIAGAALLVIDFQADNNAYHIGSHEFGPGGSSSTSEVGQFKSTKDVVQAVKTALTKF